MENKKSQTVTYIDGKYFSFSLKASKLHLNTHRMLDTIKVYINISLLIKLIFKVI